MIVSVSAKRTMQLPVTVTWKLFWLGEFDVNAASGSEPREQFIVPCEGGFVSDLGDFVHTIQPISTEESMFYVDNSLWYYYLNSCKYLAWNNVTKVN